MALSNITVKGLTPDLSVLGAYQRFHFFDDPVTKLQSFNEFTPANILTDAENNIELRNYLFGGYRFHQASHFDEIFYPGTFKFQYFTNDGAGTDIWTYGGAYFRFNVPVQFQPFEGDLDMGGYKIINLAAPILGTDAANKDYVDSHISGGTVTLTGDVTGSGLVNTSFPTTLTLHLDQILSPLADVNLNNYKIVNLAAPVLGTDATTKTYVDSKVSSGVVTLTGNVTGSGTIGTPFATTLTLRLDQITAPALAVNLNNQKITNLATPTLASDAATKGYVDGKTWTVSQITNFNTSVAAFRLDQFAVPTANISMGGFKITNLGTPTLSTDAATKNYVDTFPFTLPLDYSPPSSTYQSFIYPYSSNDFKLINNFAYNVSTTATMNLLFSNYQGYGYKFNHITTFNSQPYGVLNLQLNTPTSSTTVFSVTPTNVLFSRDIDMGSTVRIHNLPAPLIGEDAANKTYVDNKVSTGVVTLTGNVTGSGTIGTPFVTNLALRLDQITAPQATLNLNNQKIMNLLTPVLTSDAATKGYVDSYVSGGTVTLTGNVTGSGTIGTPFATTLTLRLDQITAPALAVNLNNQSIYNALNVGVGISAPHGRIHIDNTFENRKIILYEAANNNYQFQGFGTTASLLTYNVEATSSDHVWYAGTSASTRSELFRVRGNGAVIVASSGTFYGYRPFACAYMQSNATSSSLTANTWAKVAGTTTLQSSTADQFTMLSSNRITYGGEQPVTSMIHVSGDFTVTAAGATIASFAIFKNGVQIIPSAINFSVGSGTQSIFSLSCPASLGATDYLEVWCKTAINSTCIVNDMIFSVTTA